MHSGQSKLRRHPPEVAARHAAGANVFRREGEYWTIAYSGTVLRLRDTKGLRCLAHLLRHPGEHFAACDLLAAADASAPQTLKPSGPQPLAPDAERARLAVTKRIKSAIQRIQEHYPALGYHLSMTIKTGAHCIYLPDPERPLVWPT